MCMSTCTHVHFHISSWLLFVFFIGVCFRASFSCLVLLQNTADAVTPVVLTTCICPQVVSVLQNTSGVDHVIFVLHYTPCVCFAEHLWF